MTNSIQFEPPTGGALPDPLGSPICEQLMLPGVDVYMAGSTYSLRALMQRTALSPKIAALLPNINDTRTKKQMTNELQLLKSLCLIARATPRKVWFNRLQLDKFVYTSINLMYRVMIL